jgi:hypothetical protein
VKETELQQCMSKNNGEKFFQELFEEEHLCSVIIQCPRL